MPARLSDEKQEQVRNRRYVLGESVKQVADAMGLTRSTVSHYAPARAADVPPATTPLPPERGTLQSQIAQRFGARREPFHFREVRESFPERHRVFVSRMIRRLIDAGVLARLKHGLYVGTCVNDDA